MIIDELQLHNFGIYRGSNTLKLAPPSREEPVVLIGGLNGGGKTTLLDAIQLALYGKLARCSNRGSLGYGDFLGRCINRSVSPSVGAGVRLTFRHAMDGEERKFEIHRTWKDPGKGVRERVHVSIDGDPAPHDAEHWLERMEEILPVRIAHLFFFDGEQVQRFAEPDTAADLLSTAVRALLGVDLVDQLADDLVVLGRRQKASLADAEKKGQIEALEAEVATLQGELDLRVLDLAELNRTLDDTRKKIAKNEIRLKESGALRLEQRKALEREHEHLRATIDAVEGSLRELAGDAAPLALVQPLLAATSAQLTAEREAREAKQLARLLHLRDDRVLDVLRNSGISADKTGEVERLLGEDRATWSAKSEVDVYLNLPPAHAEMLQGLLSGDLAALRARAGELLDREEQLQRRIVDVQRQLAAIPERDTVAKLFEDRERLRGEELTIQHDIARTEGEIQAMRRDLEQKQHRLTLRLDELVAERFKRHEHGRIVRHTSRARDTLVRFRELLVAQHVSDLERLIQRSFQRLVRKANLVSRVSIDPETFTMNVRGADGDVQPMERLSAGERQLLAVAILWGLASAAGRQIPVVIDTPLGRLDSVHRGKLVKHYFPAVSRQVVLLSTDEEIDERYHQKLRSKVGRSYLLDFDPDRNCTEVQERYFW